MKRFAFSRLLESASILAISSEESWTGFELARIRDDVTNRTDILGDEPSYDNLSGLYTMILRKFDNDIIFQDWSTRRAKRGICLRKNPPPTSSIQRA